ncbi:MAG: hypothetical protein ABIN01_23785 [Ferruginibacter sp.]
MQTTHLIITAAIVMTGFTACNNSAKDTAKQDATVLSQYVDSVENLRPVYTRENWTAIDNGYQQRALTAEKTIAELEAADQAKAEESKKKYAAFKASYEAKLQEQEAAAKVEVATPTATSSDYRQVLRNRLFGEGKIGSDMKFGFVNGNNILDVYKNFVTAVADNKNNYTREDWDEIKVLYEALDTRKNAVEKDISSGDNVKIAGQKVKFASIRATHRGGTKVSENEKAKE